jgi:hypothetical protein
MEIRVPCGIVVFFILDGIFLGRQRIKKKWFRFHEKANQSG